MRHATLPPCLRASHNAPPRLAGWRAGALVLLQLTSGCRLLSGEVACERGGDCPESLPRCEGATDAGPGECQPARDGGADGDEDAGSRAGAPTDGGRVRDDAG